MAPGRAATSRLDLSRVMHILVILTSLSIAFSVFDGTLFAWHPLFMSIGYLLFMAEGLMSALGFRMLDGPDRVAGINGHALLQIRATLAIILGFGVIYKNKLNLGKPHFKTLHGKFGLATLIFSLLAPIGGAISFKKLGFLQKFPEPWQPRLKNLHRKIGALTWFMSLVTIELALPHKAVHRTILTPLWQVAVAVMGVIMMVLILRRPPKAKEVPELSAKAV